MVGNRGPLTDAHDAARHGRANKVLRGVVTVVPWHYGSVTIRPWHLPVMETPAWDPASQTGVVAMLHFIFQANIAHYQELLAIETDARKDYHPP